MFNYTYFLFFIIFKLCNSEYNYTLANIGVWLSGAAYCGIHKYNSMILEGPLTNFKVTNTIYDPITDIEGYIGYLEENIYIVIRGTKSNKNMLDDMEIKLVQYNTWLECNCKVHYGFYRSVLNIKKITIYYLKKLQKKNPSYKIIITGHSYGSACADLLSLELLKENITSIYYGYGKPRVGDYNYSVFLNSKIKEHYRHTHYKDIFPHTIPRILGYYHSCQEIYEDYNGEFKKCSSSNCEDETCGNQYKLLETNINDHYKYFGYNIINCSYYTHYITRNI